MLSSRFAIFALLLTGAAFGDERHPHRPSSVPSRRPGRVEDKEHWYKDAQDRLSAKIGNPQLQITAQAKNVIFFLGDGMSVATVTAARILSGQQPGSGVEFGEEAELHMDTFPHVGISRTFCTDVQTADSACTATAYLCGTKANDGTIGVAPSVFLGNNCSMQMDPVHQVSSVLAWAQAAGKSTGVVTTMRVTHASPAGNYAHTAHRDWESDFTMERDGQDSTVCDDIAEQLVLREPGRNIDVVMGGGRREFLPNTTVDPEHPELRGRRLDRVNLIESWVTAHPEPRNKYITSRAQLTAVETLADAGQVDKLLGLFEYDHLGYFDELEAYDDPTLEDMTRVAIKILSQNPNGFFLFVEGGKIDWAHHDAMAKRALVETIEMDKAIGRADAMTEDGDTLILVTADHSHTMTINGYQERGSDILRVTGELDENGLPYTTLSYANGPGYKGPGYNASEDPALGEDGYRYMAMVPVDFETHGADDVQIFSKGPFAHFLTGSVPQSYIPHVIAYAACIGEREKWEGCGGGQGNGTQSSGATGVAVILFSIILAINFVKLIFNF